MNGRKTSNPSHEESDTDTENKQALSLTNGSLIRHRPPPLMVVSYRGCLKNHAANLGGVALDGCGEFMATPTATLSDPTSLKCAACGCHRNFHRRHHNQAIPPPQQLPVLQWTSSPSLGQSPSPSSPTPEQSVYPSAPHMLLALSTTHSGIREDRRYDQNPGLVMNPQGKKRARTRFSEEQREKIQCFAEKLGWRMLRGNDEKIIEDFCNGIGVKRNVFKVWMHNNKHRKEKGSDEEKIGFLSYNKYDSFGRYEIVKNEVHVHGSTTTDASSPSSS
ncbi:zinc-finger homeodomain protein 11-like [Mercurialis annua]|uniref:zinc-finger homeodomain protein 11-like n=1 Tax=Mercurialis annua TaxID=3986 RepID=UPI0021600A5E|nr:zinc-finger homeodomain protein 11-like [Mercurialis annua]